jgi:multiple antibiotic resistance protein
MIKVFMMQQDILQATVTLFALVNPVLCAGIFSNISGSLTPQQRVLNAIKAVVVIYIVLSLSALFGTKVLSLFGVSLDAFSFAGGGILSFIGINMILKAESAWHRKEEDPTTEVSLAPLILFAASPGTITGVITVSSSHSGTALPISALLASAIISTILLFILIIVSYLPLKSKKPSMTHQMITSYLGVIVVAMGVQFAFTGFKQFMY